jgi:hypothetical protein
MTVDEILADLDYLASKIWCVPPGFATLIAGSFVIVAAIIAWRGVQRQIGSQREIESDRERRILETGLTAELFCYSASIVEAVSRWNVRARDAPAESVGRWPQFPRPRFYEAVIGRIGLLGEPWVASALIGFYGNLLELNDMAIEPNSDPRTIGESVGGVARRLQNMSINLAQALDGLNADREFAVPPEIDLHQLVAPDGSAIGNDPVPATSLQALLRRLGGRSSSQTPV